MDKDEFLTAMNRVAEALPDQSSPEMTSLFIANIILIYEQEKEWPHMMMAVTTILADAMVEEKAEGEAAATEDAKAFLKNIMENHNG